MGYIRTIIGLLLIVFGGFILVDQVGIYEFPFSIWSLVLPLVVIAVGIVVFVSAFVHFGRRGSTGKELDEVLVFNGLESNYANKEFAGGNLTGVFAGFDLNLRDCKPSDKELKLSVTNIFAGLELRVPENWEVKTDVVGVFGGVENNTKNPENPEVTLKIDGTAIFGGVEIKN